MARSQTKRTPSPPPAESASITVRATLDLNDDVPVFYVNYAEISHSVHEFALVGARMPTKPSPAQIEEVTATGELRVQPSFQALIPPNMIPGLIRALSAQRDTYEARFGPIKDLGAEDEK